MEVLKVFTDSYEVPFRNPKEAFGSLLLFNALGRDVTRRVEDLSLASQRDQETPQPQGR